MVEKRSTEFSKKDRPTISTKRNGPLHGDGKIPSSDFITERKKMELIKVRDAARELQCSEERLRQQIRSNPAMVGFPVVVVGSAIKIPREGFYRYLGGEQSA